METQGIREGEARVIQVLEQEVAARSLGPGSRLPTERDLARLSSQPRATVRRALEGLEADRKIVRYVGRGTFLSTAPAVRDRAVLTDASPAEIMAARLLIEPQMAPLIVAAGTPADFGEMERCLRGGESTDSYHEFSAWGSALHRAFAEATHNQLFVQLSEMYELHDNPLWSSLLRRTSTPARLVEYRSDHEAIVASLTERDADTARELMRQHVARIRTNVLGEHVY